VKQIISEHGGEVEVASEPGKQTTFRITLLNSQATTEVGGNGAKRPEPIADVEDLLVSKDSVLANK